MKKIKFTITCFLILIGADLFGQSTITQNLDGLTSIEFPEKPVVSDLPNGLGIFYKCMKNPNYYLAFLFKVNSNTIVTNDSTLNNLYEGIISGAANPEKAKTLIYKKNITVKNFRGIEFEYKDATNPDKIRFIYQRALYINNTVFVYSFSTPDETNSEYKTEKDLFLNSFSILDKTAKQF